MPSFSLSSCLVFTRSTYGLLYCQIHSLQHVWHVLEYIYIYLDKANANIWDVWDENYFYLYQLQKRNR